MCDCETDEIEIPDEPDNDIHIEKLCCLGGNDENDDENDENDDNEIISNA